MIAMGYYGGKSIHLNDILPLLPYGESYVEPFAGSATVLLNRRASKLEVLNDLNQDIPHFFETLRGARGFELIEKIALTPYSRAEYSKACEATDIQDAVERARLWYTRISQSRNNIPNARPRNWSFATQFPRREMAGPVSKWLSKPSELADVISRILTVQIECDDALEVIKRYDNAGCVMYIDPPYVTSTRRHSKVYKYEMDDQAHRLLSDVLHGCKGQVALSGYNGSLYDELYADWDKTVFDEKMVGSAARKRGAQEVLWCNYDSSKVKSGGQIPMFED